MLLNPHKNQREFITLCALIMALNAVAVDILLPALPLMTKHLGAQAQNQQHLIISIYLLGFGISQLFYGPIADAIGRKKTVIIGTILFFIPVAYAPFAPDFKTLLFLRFMQGIGAGASRVVASAMVRDVFSGNSMAQIMSFIMMIFMVVPIIAPSLGQALLFIAPWYAGFAFMAIMALITLLWVSMRLPETLQPENKRPLNIKSVLTGFKTVLTTKESVLLALANSMLLATLIGFLGISPLIYLNIYDLGAFYPLMIALTAGNLAVASLINTKIVHHFGAYKISLWAKYAYVGLAFIWCVLAFFIEPLPLWLLIILHQPLMLCFGFASTNQMSLAMQPLGKIAGTAASLFGCMSSVIGAILGAVMGFMYNGTIFSVGVSFLIYALIALLLTQLVRENALKPHMSAPTK